MELVRDRTIDTILSNMLMANLILPRNIPEHMKLLQHTDDITLALILIESRLALDKYYEHTVYMNRDYYIPNGLG